MRTGARVALSTAATVLAVWAAAIAAERGHLAAALVAFGLASLVAQAHVARAQARSRRTLERLRLELDAERRFVAQAAHELRGPITVAYGQLSLALRRPRGAEEYRAALAEALDATRDLRAVAEDLLALGRARAPAPFEPTSIAKAARGALRLVRADADRASIAIDLRVQDALVSGRGGDLVRMLRNLMENAVRHSPARGRVVVDAAIVGSFAEIAVADEGEGVPEAERGRLFEPFFRGARARADEGGGAGLGLSIVRAIARAHGGDVHLDAAYGGGARFVVRLPLSSPAPSRPPAPAELTLEAGAPDRAAA